MTSIASQQVQALSMPKFHRNVGTIMSLATFGLVVINSYNIGKFISEATNGKLLSVFKASRPVIHCTPDPIITNSVGNHIFSMVIALIAAPTLFYLANGSSFKPLSFKFNSFSSIIGNVLGGYITLATLKHFMWASAALARDPKGSSRIFKFSQYATHICFLRTLFDIQSLKLDFALSLAAMGTVGGSLLYYANKQ